LGRGLFTHLSYFRWDSGKHKDGFRGNEKVLLCGKKEFIDFRVAKIESETQWEGFLNNLFYRGLKGENLKLYYSGWLCWFT